MTLSILTLLSQHSLAEINWLTDIGDAQARGMLLGRPVWVHFTGMACVPCRRFDINVLSRPDVINLVHQNYVPVRVVGEMNPKLLAAHKIDRIPTDLIIHPVTGAVLHKGLSLQDVEQFKKLLLDTARHNKFRDEPLGNAPLPTVRK